MGITKAVNSKTKSRVGMKNVLNYIFKQEKNEEQFRYVTGPHPLTTLDAESVFQLYCDEQARWGKLDKGRCYAHYVVSFAPDEKIDHAMAYSLGIELAEKNWPKHNTAIAVHQDKEHIHIHFVVNAVSFEDGKKLHIMKSDLAKFKKNLDGLCEDYGLTITEKGKHFDKTPCEEISTFSTSQYQLLARDAESSFQAACALAVLRAMEEAHDKESFIQAMDKQGWDTAWSDKKVHVTFVRKEDGSKVRDKKVSQLLASPDFNCFHFENREELLHAIETSGRIRAEAQKYEEIGNGLADVSTAANEAARGTESAHQQSEDTYQHIIDTASSIEGTKRRLAHTEQRTSIFLELAKELDRTLNELFARIPELGVRSDYSEESSPGSEGIGTVDAKALTEESHSLIEEIINVNVVKPILADLEYVRDMIRKAEARIRLLKTMKEHNIPEPEGPWKPSPATSKEFKEAEKKIEPWRPTPPKEEEKPKVWQPSSAKDKTSTASPKKNTNKNSNKKKSSTTKKTNSVKEK